MVEIEMDEANMIDTQPRGSLVVRNEHGEPVDVRLNGTQQTTQQERETLTHVRGGNPETLSGNQDGFSTMYSIVTEVGKPSRQVTSSPRPSSSLSSAHYYCICDSVSGYRGS